MLPASAVDRESGRSFSGPSLSFRLLDSAVPAMSPAKVKTHYIQTCVYVGG